MVVFVTLMVALIGAYTQIYTKQAAIGYAQQSGVASAMIAWHSTAVALATKYLKSSSYTAAGCSLTSLPSSPTVRVPSTVPSFCMGSNGVADSRVSSTNYIVPAPTLCSGSAGAPCFTLLPTGYLATPYTFYSIAFRSASKNYVLTYVPLPSDSYNAGLLCLPGNVGAGACAGTHAQVSTTFKALYKEMGNNSLLSPMSYGKVMSAGVLTTPNIRALFDSTSAGIMTYTVPGITIVPVESIGIISEIQACTAC
ncbi:MAG: hypothetical protein WC521_09125 [Bdellovibrionales bacterium]